MRTLLDLKSEQQEALNKAEAAMRPAQAAGRSMTPTETATYHSAMAEFNNLTQQVANASQNHGIFAPDGTPASPSALLLGGNSPAARTTTTRSNRTGQHPMNAEYTNAFMSYVRSNGKIVPDGLQEGFDATFGGFALPALPSMSAAMYEGTLGGSNSAGGYALSLPTIPQITPLGMPDVAMLEASMVIPTSGPIKIPSQATFGGAAIKAESGSSTNTFAETDPTLGQITLDAYMLGNARTASWESLADIPVFQQFLVDDLLNAVAIAEEGYYVTGTGSGQPQGIAGNVGTGSGSAYALTGTASTDNVTLLDAVFDLAGSLKAVYYPNASFILSRATATAIRKAQMQTNLYAQVLTRDADGTERLLGYPVRYSSNVPNLPSSTNAGTASIYFGDFRQGYVIGQRGGAGTFVKVLDQPLATSGQVVLLGYKRTDGRVRCAEAIQQVKFSHS